MVTYDSNNNLYKVFKRTLTEKRAKRDGRNPATGAFSAGSHTGSVDLTVDIPSVKGSRNVNISDKTGYTKNINSPDYLVNDFDDRIDYNVNYVSENHSESTITISDKYGNEIVLDYVLEIGDILLFSDTVIGAAFKISEPKLKFFGIEEDVYSNASFRRTVKGKLLGTGRMYNGTKLVADYELGSVFPEYNP